MTNGVAPLERTDGLGFAEWLAQVLTRWRVLVVTEIVVIVLTIIATYVIPPIYRGHASFLAVPNKTSGLSGGLSALTGLGGSGLAQQFGLGSMGDPTSSPQFYQQLVASRELLTRLATATYADPRQPGGHATATLVTLIGPHNTDDPRKTLEMTVQRLGKRVRATPDPKTNLVAITVDTRWPDLSATVANRVTALVDSFNVRQRQSRGRARRVFAESRVTDAQGTLRTAEDRLRDFQQTNRQWQQSPTLSFEQARLRRQVEVESELYLTLRRELETSRLDEVNDTPVITVVDSAVAPTIREWPKRTQVVIASIFVGLFIAVLVTGAVAVLSDWARRHPGEAEDLRSAAAGVVRAIPGVRGRWPRTADAGDP